MDVYAGLFEIANWLVSIAARFDADFGLKPEVSGIRYARNVTHHGWASAVEYSAERCRWQWRRTELLPEGKPQSSDTKADYEHQLAGQPVCKAFEDLLPAVMKLAPATDLS